MLFRRLTVILEQFDKHDRLIDMLHLHIGCNELLELIKVHYTFTLSLLDRSFWYLLN
jgi:hypothetical protein